MSEVETYVVHLNCNNCNEDNRFTITKGMFVGIYLMKEHPTCNYCGCRFKLKQPSS